MKGYIIKYNGDLVSVTNNVKKWLRENNKRRLEEGEERESLDTFFIEEVSLNIYKEKEDLKKNDM